MRRRASDAVASPVSHRFYVPTERSPVHFLNMFLKLNLSLLFYNCPENMISDCSLSVARWSVRLLHACPCFRKEQTLNIHGSHTDRVTILAMPNA